MNVGMVILWKVIDISSGREQMPFKTHSLYARRRREQQSNDRTRQFLRRLQLRTIILSPMKSSPHDHLQPWITTVTTYRYRTIILSPTKSSLHDHLQPWIICLWRPAPWSNFWILKYVSPGCSQGVPFPLRPVLWNYIDKYIREKS